MTDKKPWGIFAGLTHDPSQPKPKKPPIIKHTCGSCGHVILFDMSDSGSGLCTCGCCLVRAGEGHNEYEILYSSVLGTLTFKKGD